MQPSARCPDRYRYSRSPRYLRHRRIRVASSRCRVAGEILAQRVPATRYLYIACNVAAGYTQGWQWKVRARTSDGREGELSAPYYMNFTECRLTSGLRCGEQPAQ